MFQYFEHHKPSAICRHTHISCWCLPSLEDTGGKLLENNLDGWITLKFDFRVKCPFRTEMSLHIMSAQATLAVIGQSCYAFLDTSSSAPVLFFLISWKRMERFPTTSLCFEGKISIQHKHTHAGITDLQHACWHLNHKTVNLEMWFLSCLTHTEASFSPLFSQAVAFQLYTHSWQYTEKVSGLFFPLKPSPDPQSTWSRTQEQHFMFF